MDPHLSEVPHQQRLNMSLPEFTCITCGVSFPDSATMREHYKTDLHRYNLKRKIVGMPPVSADEFSRRVLTQRASASSAQEESRAVYVCAYTKKRFKSRHAYETHTRSKKYKQLVARAQADKARAAAAAAAAAAAEDETAGEEKKTAEEEYAPPSKEGEEEGGDGADEISAPVQDSGIGAADDSPEPDQEAVAVHRLIQPEPEPEPEPTGDSDGEWEDDDEGEGGASRGDDNDADAWEPRLRESFFDGHVSASFEENVEYMRKKFSFIVPERRYLADPKGLFSYLQEKVCRYHACICCNRAFRSLESVRNHMMDKSHCKVNFDEDDGMLELAEFYDFRKSYPDWVPGDEDNEEADLAVAIADGLPYLDGDDDSADLVLPNGARAVHRDMAKYYKQHFRPEDDRLSVRTARHLAEEAGMMQGKAVKMTPQQKRAQAQQNRYHYDHRTKTGMANNKIQGQYFRLQVMQ